MASKDHSSHLDDDSEETVSLCDLPVYGYDTDHSTTTPCDHQDSMIKQDESFAFFSQEWLENSKDSNFFPNKDNLFGGYNGNSILPRKPISQEFKKHDQGSSKDDQESGKLKTPMKRGGKNETKRVFPASASMKSRWYYYGFGLAGIPAEMDLRAIKSRQNRRRNEGVGGGGGGGGGKEEGGGFRQGKGLRRLIRDLSCDGQSQANSMVKASLVYIPRV